MSEREQKLVDEILALHRDIRFCGVIDRQGNSIARSMKQGVQSLEPDSQFPKLILQLTILAGADKDWDVYLGPTDYFLIHKSKVNLLLYPINGLRAVLVSTDPSLSTDKLDGVRNAIERYENVQ